MEHCILACKIRSFKYVIHGCYYKNTINISQGTVIPLEPNYLTINVPECFNKSEAQEKKTFKIENYKGL